MDDIKDRITILGLMEMGDRLHGPGGEEPISKIGSAEALLRAMEHGEKTGSHDGFIENMEAQGQKELVAASEAGAARLPVIGTLRGHHVDDVPEAKAQLESYGVVFGEVVATDDIWVEATLPPGWKIESTEHAMWNHLLDDKGRERAAIFYKAAFYDRSCHLRTTARFSTNHFSVNPDTPYDTDGDQIGLVLDGDQEIEKFGPFKSLPKPEGRAEFDTKNPWRSYDIARDAAEAWLDEHYPDWHSASAYWD